MANYYPYQGRKQQYAKRASSGQKSQQIKELASRREQSINNAIQQKELGIIVSSAQRDAMLWCTHHPDWKNPMNDEDRMTWVNTIADMFIQFSVEKKAEAPEIIEELRNGQPKVEETNEITFNE